MDWKLVAITFGLLFVAELGDKTQLAVITLTSKHQRPWAIFLGATLALALVTLLGVLAGQAIARIVPADVLQKLAAAAFIVIGILIWFGVL